MEDDHDLSKGPRGWFAYAPNTGAAFGEPVAGDERVQRPAEPDYVELMVDYGVDVPLWGIPWTTLDLSPQLLARLREWQERFEDHCHYERGWDDPAVAAAWSRERDRLAGDLRQELGPRVEVRVRR